jgi:hypothetical protein
VGGGTLALLHLDGPNGSSTFTDAAGNSWSAVNGATLTTSHFKFGTASLASTTNQHITTPDNPTWEFTGDFTLECFVYFNALSSGGINTSFLGQTGTVGGSSWLLFQDDLNDHIHFYASNSHGSYGFNVTGPLLSTGQWYHCALVRSSGTVTAYLNGTSFGSATLTGTISTNGQPIGIGGDIANIGEIFNGYIDEVRISNIALYTANFTPPTAPFPFSNVTALLHFDGANGSTTMVDEYPGTWVRDNTAHLSTAWAQFGPSSLLLNGTTDCITTTDDLYKPGSADFTFECWGNATDVTGSRVLFGSQIFGSPNNGIAFFLNMGQLTMTCANSTFTGFMVAMTAGAFVTANVPHHYAFVRHGNQFDAYLDGVSQWTVTASGSIGSTQSGLAIGAAFPALGGGSVWAGYIDEVRISMGVAQYTGNFTPPTSPFTTPAAAYSSDPGGGYVVVTSGYATGTAAYQFDCLPCLAGNANVPSQMYVQGIYPCADGAHIVILTANASDASPLEWNVVNVTGGSASLVAYGSISGTYFPSIAALSGDFSDSSPNNTTQFKGCLDGDLQTLWLWEGGSSANGLSILQLSGGTTALLYSTASVFSNSALAGPGAMLAANGYGAFIRSNTLALWTILPATSAMVIVQTARTYVGVATGSYYWEVIPTFINPTGIYRIGIATATFPLSGPVGIGSDTSASSVGWSYLGGIFYNGTQIVADGTYPFNMGDVLGFAFNASTGTLSMYRNGVFVFTLSGIASNTWFPAMSVSAIGSATVFNLGANTFTYSPPAAYASLFVDTISSTDGPDALYLDLFVNDVPLATGVACQNLNRLVRLDYLGFIGDLIWQDTHGTNDPTSPGLGTRYQLCYIESTDPVPALP